MSRALRFRFKAPGSNPPEGEIFCLAKFFCIQKISPSSGFEPGILKRKRNALAIEAICKICVENNQINNLSN